MSRFAFEHNPFFNGQAGQEDRQDPSVAGLFLVELVAAAVGLFVPLLAIVGSIATPYLSIYLAFWREPKVGAVWAFAAAAGLFVGGVISVLWNFFTSLA